MSKQKFTPGPWYVDEYVDAVFICTDNFNIAEMMPKETASAYLIAAAPDLYAALEELLCSAELLEGTDPYDWSKDITKARAALAKARGET